MNKKPEEDYSYTCPVCETTRPLSRMHDYGRISRKTGEVVYDLPPLCNLTCMKALVENIFYTK